MTEEINKVINAKADYLFGGGVSLSDQQILETMKNNFKSGANWMLEEMAKCMEWAAQNHFHIQRYEGSQNYNNWFGRDRRYHTTTELITKYFETNNH